MNAQEKHRIKSLLRKSRIASGKKYMKQADRRLILEGYHALKNLGIYSKPAYECDRKEKRKFTPQ